MVAAVDADAAGHALAGRIRELVHGHDLVFRRDVPERAKDWNEVLQRVERDFIRSLAERQLLARGPSADAHRLIRRRSCLPGRPLQSSAPACAGRIGPSLSGVSP